MVSPVRNQIAPQESVEYALGAASSQSDKKSARMSNGRWLFSSILCHPPCTCASRLTFVQAESHHAKLRAHLTWTCASRLAFVQAILSGDSRCCSRACIGAPHIRSSVPYFVSLDARCRVYRRIAPHIRSSRAIFKRTDSLSCCVERHRAPHSFKLSRTVDVARRRLRVERCRASHSFKRDAGSRKSMSRLSRSIAPHVGSIPGSRSTDPCGVGESLYFIVVSARSLVVEIEL